MNNPKRYFIKCRPTKTNKNQQKPTKTNENQQKPTKTNKNKLQKLIFLAWTVFYNMNTVMFLTKIQ